MSSFFEEISTLCNRSGDSYSLKCIVTEIDHDNVVLVREDYSAFPDHALNHTNNTALVTIPKTLRARGLLEPEGPRATVHVYNEWSYSYNFYFLDGERIVVNKPEDLPAGCRFVYWIGNPLSDSLHKNIHVHFYALRNGLKSVVEKLGLEYTPGDDGAYVAEDDEKRYFLRIFDGFYDEDELKTVAGDSWDVPWKKCDLVSEGTHCVGDAKYHYKIYSQGRDE